MMAARDSLPERDGMKQGRGGRVRFLELAVSIGVVCASVAGIAGRLEGEESAKEAPGPTGEEPSKEGKGGSPPASRKLGIDEEYVRANLEKRLSPTSISFLDDGRVRLTFDFESKTEEQSGAFLPNISKKSNEVFRWTNRDDEYWASGLSTTTLQKAEHQIGVKIANAGAAHLDLWFTDEVEAEIDYYSAVNSTKKQLVAVVFTNESKKSIGSDLGVQCLTLSSGKPVKTVDGEPDPLKVHTLARLKLVVKNGSYEAWRDGKQKAKAEYKKKDFASGRVGIVWSNVGSFINRLEISGKLDYKKVAADLRKKK